MKICEEMVKLREGLDKRNIAWVDATTYAPKEYIEHMMKNGFTEAESNVTIFRTHFRIKDHFYSVVYGYGTYGGIDPVDPEITDAGLLELRIDSNNPQGWLDAKEILDMVDKA